MTTTIKATAILTISLLLALAFFAKDTFSMKDTSTLNGGGEIVQGDYHISFGGNAMMMGDMMRGQLQTNFHMTSNVDINGGVFHSSEITFMKFFDGNSPNCHAALRMDMLGRFNGEEGWMLTMRVGDSAMRGAGEDTVRFELKDPGGLKVYDTHGGDFNDESSCVGTARTGLDNGNIKLKAE